MKTAFKYFFKLTLFWLSFFLIQRVVFLLFHYEKLTGISFYEILYSNYIAFGLDISATSYLIFFPFILFAINQHLQKNNIVRLINIIVIVTICINVLISVSDIGLYGEWGTKFSIRAKESMASVSESFSVIFSINNLLFLSLAASQFFLWIFLYVKFIRLRTIFPSSLASKILFSLLMVVFLTIGIRGGFGSKPVNKSSAYFSNQSILNNAALNGFWNFFDIVFKEKEKSNPYKYFEYEKSKAVFEKLHFHEQDSSVSILTILKPNIIFIMLESVGADAVSFLGGSKGITPTIDSLAKNGLAFTQFYATGFRTDQGILAFLSGFPGLPQSVLIKDVDKVDKLPNLITVLKENNYYTSYFYGGKINYFNTDIYLKSAGIDKIVADHNYSFKRKTQWGAYDEELFAMTLDECDKNKQPFFSALITSTSHEWFEADVPDVFGSDNKINRYKNTVHYTDKCLSDFIKNARKKKWYANTLFIVTADHAHFYPFMRKYNETDRHRIPFIIFGDVLKNQLKGKTVNNIASQIDFPLSLLSLLHIKNKDFPFSKNVFSTSVSDFAFYTFDNGFGYIKSNGKIVFDHNLHRVIFNTCKTSDSTNMLVEGKSYMEFLYESFLNLSKK